MLDLLRQRGIRSERVLAAMNKVPRHLFVESALQSKAYEDHALPIAGGQTISQPFMVAKMTELLEVGPNDRVLEIGAGSGYQTAVLSYVAGRVLAIERISELARSAQQVLISLGIHNASVKCFDGTIGWSEFAPYRGILVAAGGPEIPKSLCDQLAEGGNLVIPIGPHEKQELIRVHRTATGFVEENHGPCVFVPLIGRYGWEN
ncbi:MAG TPA: protein-L-isoaspartate(D-aspartate) O-methyltransferase [Blastocatellia bacterium]|nr:protein-L-isoaspartate(D-aspartate) O-methyltransferase [Blastocatellia bacterium]